MAVADIGGALSGLPFVLSKAGAHVVNIDPFVDYGVEGEYRDVDPHRRVAELNRVFRTDVKVFRATATSAALADGSLDAACSISTLEHLDAAERTAAVSAAAAALKTGGVLVLTIDLFLDVQPFTTSMSNRWGTNVDVASLVAESGLVLHEGDPAELLGYPAFDPDRIRAGLDSYLVGDHSVLAQCLVLRKE